VKSTVIPHLASRTAICRTAQTPLALCVCVALLLAGCRIGAEPSEPVSINITAPTNNAIVPVGRPVHFAVSATAQDGVARIELSVNGTLVAVSNSPTPTNQYDAIISYTPLNAGPLNIIVRAFDKKNTASAPVGLSLQAALDGIPSPATTGIATAATDQPPRSTPTTVPGVSGPGGCILNAQFIADVTVPDGATIPLGDSFIKTWRVRNSGTCAWDNQYKLVFASGNQLGAPGSVVLSPTASGDVTDVSVPMQAPSTGTGSLTGVWRFAAPDNTIFGNRLTVVITLPAPPPTPTPTLPPPTATPTPTVGFTANTMTLALGACTWLHWTTSNVAAVFLDGEGVPSPSEKEICPTETTTYTLKIDFNDGTSATRQVVVNVVAPAAIYSFSDNAPTAQWRNDAGESLAFGGPDGDSRGFALMRDGAMLEDNSTQTKVIETHPRMADGGSIFGQYDVPVVLQTGDRFRTRLAFLKGTGIGTVTVRLWFNSTIIGETSKSYDEAIRDWSVDLSAYAGQSGRFTLQVINSPDNTQGPLCWINPHIER
jgi:hypothetical protein